MYAKAIEVALNYQYAVGALLASGGYSPENARAISDINEIHRTFPTMRGLVAVVTVDVASFDMESADDVRWDSHNFDLKSYGWLGAKPGMYMDLIRDGVMGFWEE